MAGNDLNPEQQALIDSRTSEEHLMLSIEYHRTEFIYGWLGREDVPGRTFLLSYLDWLAKRDSPAP